MIEKSIDLKSGVLLIDEKSQNFITARMKKHGQSRKVNLMEQIQELELTISNMMASSGDTNDQGVLEVRSHLIDLYTRVGVGLLKRHHMLIEMLMAADGEWQETAD